VYIDIGAGDWLGLRTAARLLRVAGVRYARGFALNATHFDWTRAEVAYGKRLSRMVGGKHFVVNTAFNGRGPKLRGKWFHKWSNPSGRALGPLPTTRTPTRLADAFYWLNTPGDSDGHCNGGPSVGAFWLPWALDFVRLAAGAPDYPVYRGGH
jgi:endoglucanase